MKKDMKIAVAGTGYVGLSIATLLSQHHQVTAVDVIPEKVDLINRRKSPIQDEYIEKYLAEKELNLTATLDGAKAYAGADFVVIAAPTNYDPVKNYFDTSHVEEVIELVKEVNPHAIMVIKSTIPVGYTESVRKKLGTKNVIFSPEFLRESKALYDNLYPSRIIVGRPEGDARLDEAAHDFAALLQEGAIKEDIDTLFMGLTEYANKAYELEQSTVHVLQNSAIAAVIKVVSSVILLKTLGFTGGALGSVVAFASYFIITCVRVRSRFLFRVAPISLVRIIVSALLCGAAAFACTLLPVGNLIRLGAAVVVGAGVYAVCIIVSGEGREEVQAVLRRLKR